MELIIIINDVSYSLPVDKEKVKRTWEEENYFNIRKALDYAFNNPVIWNSIINNSIVNSKTEALVILCQALGEYYEGEQFSKEYWTREGIKILAELKLLYNKP